MKSFWPTNRWKLGHAGHVTKEGSSACRPEVSRPTSH